jgi:hypothetical protein
MSHSIKFWSFQVPRIQNQWNLTQFGSLKFNSNSILNSEKLLWGSLFLIILSTCTYFIWKILCEGRQPLDGINITKFGKYLKNINPHCSRGGLTGQPAIPLSSATSTSRRRAAVLLSPTCSRSSPTVPPLLGVVPPSPGHFSLCREDSPPPLFFSVQGYRWAAVLPSFSNSTPSPEP